MVLALSACKTKPPHYDLCVPLNDLKTLYCESSNPKKDPYNRRFSTQDVVVSIDDYGKLYKYAKQVEKDLERCNK